MTTGEYWIGVATIIAVILGPIFAVIVTRINDDWRAERQRQFEIFRTLMRTRKLPIHIDHVGALNLVEVEFRKHPKVVEAWKAYLRNLSEDLPSVEQKGKHDQAVKQRDSLLTKLISEIADALGIKVEQLDILEGNYVPQGWIDDDWEQKLVRRGLIDVVNGRRPIVIKPTSLSGQSPYPPAPNSGEE